MSLYSDKTYENLMESALSRVSSMYDKREGSMIFNGNAPCLAELAQMYAALDFILDATYIATAPREYLIKRAADRSIVPYSATNAEYKAYFNIPIEPGTRFSGEDLNFEVIENIELEDGEKYVHRIRCETSGTIGNSYSNVQLIPIEYINGLTTAEIGELLISAEDEEETEHFRNRVIEAMRSISFGGNVADYKQKILGYDPKIKAVKVFASWNKDLKPSILNLPSVDNAITSWYSSAKETLPADVVEWLDEVHSAAVDSKLTIGGAVRVIVQDSLNSGTNQNLIAEIQNYVDPVYGEGLGVAPIGHVVTVFGVKPYPIDINTKLTLKNGREFSDVKSIIVEVIKEYLETISSKWSENDKLVIYRSQIDSCILSNCDFVEDITETTINGNENNLVLDVDEIPTFGNITNI